MLAAGYDLADDGHRRRCSDLRAAGLIAQVVRDGTSVTCVSDRNGGCLVGVAMMQRHPSRRTSDSGVSLCHLAE